MSSIQLFSRVFIPILWIAMLVFPMALTADKGEPVDIVTKEPPDYVKLREFAGKVPVILEKCREKVPHHPGHSAYFKDERARVWAFRDLIKVGDLLRSGGSAELLQLVTYLRDPAAHIRYIAASAIARRLDEPTRYVEWENIINAKEVDGVIAGLLDSCIAEKLLAPVDSEHSKHR